MANKHHLIDRKVLGFKDWLAALHEEDMQECGVKIKRSLMCYTEMYNRYLEHQTSRYAIKLRWRFFREPTRLSAQKES